MNTQYLLGDHTYIPSNSIDRTKCFVAKNSIAIYGGFDRSESNENDRNINANSSILSGDIGEIHENDDNCYHVLQFSGSLILDNVIIQNGNANYQNTADYHSQKNVLHRYGAAIINTDLTKTYSIRLNRVILRNNTAINGGALFAAGSSDANIVQIVIKDSTFEYNTAIEGIQ